MASTLHPTPASKLRWLVPLPLAAVTTPAPHRPPRGPQPTRRHVVTIHVQADDLGALDDALGQLSDSCATRTMFDTGEAPPPEAYDQYGADARYSWHLHHTTDLDQTRDRYFDQLADWSAGDPAAAQPALDPEEPF